MSPPQLLGRVIGFLLLFVNVLCLPAQDLMIKEIALVGEDVHITYDLLDNDITHKYQLSLYSSNDNYILPMEMVEGDIGVDISVGGNKKAIWHARQELGADFKGDVAIELKGKLYIPFVTLNDFEDVSKMKRDRPYTLTWAAGRGSNVLTWDLYNAKSERVHTFTNIANVGEYEFVLPKDVKPGKGYTLKITDQNNKEDIVITPPFDVTRRVPLYVPSSIGGLAAGVLYLLIDRLGSNTGGNVEPDRIPDLPCATPDCN
ncbi:MAG: hypothetical protein JXQ90_10070 [Cyclobacteriaceae bacterium]